MKQPHANTSADELTRLYSQFAAGRLSRRAFMRRAAALGVAGAASAGLAPLAGLAAEAAVVLAQRSAPSRTALALDVADWGYLWVNVRRAVTARGTFVGGQQMYVEYMVPARVRHPYPVVLVHGGGGQGTDWMGTPDGRPGWFQYLVHEGFKVYVVDRPGHGRSPFHPDLHGAFPAQANTLESIAGRFTPPSANAQATPNAYQQHHTQWPGPGSVGSPDLDRLVAGMGGSYVATAPLPVATARPTTPATPPAAPPSGVPQPANLQPEGAPNLQHMAWRDAGAELLDTIGPAIIMTHSAGGPFGLLVAEARPKLVKAAIIVEGANPNAFAGANRWGVTTLPTTYDPPAHDPAELKTTWVANPEPGVTGYYIQQTPARTLPHLRNTKVLAATADASFLSPGMPGLVAFLKQAGVHAEELRWGQRGMTGNGHAMMMERNSRELLQPIIDWIVKEVPGPVTLAQSGAGDSRAMKLADSGIFWVGTANHKTLPYGTIEVGQMFVQYLEPAERRHPLPVVLVHGGGGQMLHFMGIGGKSGWAHHFVQAGYAVYLVDRPGHGRPPYHPDALGPIGPLVTYDLLTRESLLSAQGPHRQWPGTTGDVGDPLVDQLMAAANSASRDNDLASELWRMHGAELVDRIGPCILLTHSAGASFGWIVANERPQLVKAVVSFEGVTAPLTTPAAAPLANLRNVPVMYLIAANSTMRGQGAPAVEALTRLGARAELIDLKERGILGNSHLAMFETNRRQVFEVIREYIEKVIPVSDRRG